MAQALYLNLILVLWRGIEIIWGQNREKVCLDLGLDVIRFFFIVDIVKAL